MLVSHGDESTIAQRATAAGEAAVALVRLSGPATEAILSRVFRASSSPGHALRPRYAYHGFLVDPSEGVVVDEVLVTLFAEGASYTGETMAEIGCHGGILVSQRVLRLLLANGARPAEPGEFSKRAFINGRMDLTQAEAVCDLIRARSDDAARAAVRQLQGGLSACVRAIRDPLMQLLAEMEAAIDFPDDDILPATIQRAVDEANAAQAAIGRLLERAALGQALREGVLVGIIGRPNVGKSSLLNALLGRDRAIVTETPGTTRDTLEETISIDGIPFRLIDTAGVRESGDVTERLGIDRAEATARTADMVIVVFDGSEPLSMADLRVIELVGSSEARRIGVLNKADREQALTLGAAASSLACNAWASTVAVTPGGVDSLRDAMVKSVAEVALTAEGELLTNVRHRDLLEAASAELERTVGACEDGVPIDIVSIGVRAAAETLGEITGDTLMADLLDRIFSTFCLGK